MSRFRRRLLGLLLACVGFLAASPFVLPYHLILEHTLAAVAPEVARRVSWDAAGPVLPFAFRLDGVRLALAHGAPPVEVGRITLTPSVSLLAGAPGGTVRVEGPLGRLTARFATEGGLHKFTAEGTSTTLDRSNPFVSATGLPLAGGRGAFVVEAEAARGGAWEGTFRFSGEDVRTGAVRFFGADLPPLRIDRVSGGGTLSDRRVTITRFETEGGNLDLHVEGVVELTGPRRPLSLSVEAKPSDEVLNALGNLAGIATAFAGAEGGFRFRIEGTLDDPQIRFAG